MSRSLVTTDVNAICITKGSVQTVSVRDGV